MRISLSIILAITALTLTPATVAAQNNGPVNWSSRWQNISAQEYTRVTPAQCEAAYQAILNDRNRTTAEAVWAMQYELMKKSRSPYVRCDIAPRSRISGAPFSSSSVASTSSPAQVTSDLDVFAPREKAHLGGDMRSCQRVADQIKEYIERPRFWTWGPNGSMRRSATENERLWYENWRRLRPPSSEVRNGRHPFCSTAPIRILEHIAYDDGAPARRAGQEAGDANRNAQRAAQLRAWRSAVDRYQSAQRACNADPNCVYVTWER